MIRLVSALFCLLVAPALAAAAPRPALALQIGHTGEVMRVALSPDGTMVASAELDAGTVKI